MSEPNFPEVNQPEGAQLTDRAEAFREEVGRLRLSGGSAGNEQKLLTLGSVLLGVGVVLALVGPILVTSTTDPANQRAYLAQTTFVGLAFVIVGAALFVRYSLGRYLRFWLIRLVHESRENTDRVVEAIDRAAGPPSA